LDRQKKRILLTIMVVAFIQMPGLALTPGINQIKTTAFSEYSLGAVQTALAFSALAQPVAAFTAALLINRRLVTKKAVIVFGLFLLAATGLLALVMNTEFVHLIMLSIMLGIATGLFISNMFGLIFDNFDPVERQSVVGWQTSVINAGGIIMSLMGGLLARYMWYGGYIMLLVGLPAAILAIIAVPGKQERAQETQAEAKAEVEAEAEAEAKAEAKKKMSGRTAKDRLNPRIFYYCGAASLFMMTYSVCGSNLSTHIAGIGGTATAGIAIAIQMGGGVVSGLFFSKLSKRAGDYSLSFALCAVFAGYMLLSLFASSLALVFISVFIVGMALSIMLPRCIFMVSTLSADKPATATATALVSVVSPSVGIFLSPIIITNLTTALFGESTSARYRFTGVLVLAAAIIIAATTAWRGRASQPVESE